MSFGEFAVIYFMGFIGAASYCAIEKLTQYIKWRKFVKPAKLKPVNVGRYGTTEYRLIDENGKEWK